MWKAVDVNAKPIIIENKENKKGENLKVVHSNQRSFKVFSFFSLSLFLSFFEKILNPVLLSSIKITNKSWNQKLFLYLFCLSKGK